MFNKFIEKWNQMVSTCKCIESDGFHNCFNTGDPDDIPEIAKEIEDLCFDLFISGSGKPNYKNIQEISQHGFHVYPAEKDSFGWLMGACTKTDTGDTIYFG